MIPVLSLRGAKGKQQPPPNPVSSAKSIPKPAPKSEIASSSAVVAPKVIIPVIAEKKVEEKKLASTSAATATPTLAIPNIALRGAKPPQHQQQQQKSAVVAVPPKQIQLEPVSTIKAVPTINLPKQKVAVKAAAKKRSLLPSVVSKLDARCHALTCLANLSFRLAARGHTLKTLDDTQISMGVVGDVSQIALKTLKKVDLNSTGQEEGCLAPRRKDKLLKSRSKHALAFSHSIGKNIVRTALKRNHRRKIKKSKIASDGAPANALSKSKPQQPPPLSKTPIDPKLAKFREEMRQNKDQMMSISGTRKRERTVKHKKSKRQDAEIDRRALKKLFCLSCGKPKLQGAGFRTMEWRRKRTKTTKVETEKLKPEEPLTSKTTPKKSKKLLIKCISCSKGRNKKQRRMQLTKLLIQNGRKPSSMVRMKTKQRFRKKLNKKSSKKMTKISKFSVRGNTNIPLVSSVQEANLMKNWTCSGKKVTNVKIRRVVDRDSKEITSK